MIKWGATLQLDKMCRRVDVSAERAPIIYPFNPPLKISKVGKVFKPYMYICPNFRMNLLIALPSQVAALYHFKRPGIWTSIADYHFLYLAIKSVAHQFEAPKRSQVSREVTSISYKPNINKTYVLNREVLNDSLVSFCTGTRA